MFIKQIRCKACSVKSFGVVGAGQMGTGIAIVANRIAKLPVIIYDSNPSALAKSKDFINKWLSKELSKNKCSQQDVTEFNSRIRFAENTNVFSQHETDFVVEVS